MEDYYVYVYFNQTKPGIWNFREHTFEYEPFYVGKGKGKREKGHLYKSSLKKNSHKNNIIKTIIRETGEFPLHTKIYANITNEEALKIETDFIKSFGKMVDKTGILSNITNGGEGADKLSHLKERPWCHRKVYQYSLEGKFVREWKSITSVDLGFKSNSNISTSIKKGGTFANSIWSYEKKDYLEPRSKYQFQFNRIKYINIEQIDRKTNKVITVFDNVLSIEQELCLRKGAKNKIYECLNGTLKSAYGYLWKLKI